MSIIAYLRESGPGQTITHQRREITKGGWQVDKEFVDRSVGAWATFDCQGAWSRCQEYLREGDIMLVFAFEQLGRGMLEIAAQIDSLQARGVRLVVLKQGIDTGTAAGRLAVGAVLGCAELERAGKKPKRAPDAAVTVAQGERRAGLSKQEQVALKRRFDAGENRTRLAREFEISRATLYRYCEMPEAVIQPVVSRIPQVASAGRGRVTATPSARHDPSPVSARDVNRNFRLV